MDWRILMLKKELLFELETHRDIPLSGQELANRFHVSRNAVWKVINALKEEGYQIQSVRNRGYTLQSTSDILSKEGILAELQETGKNLEIRIFREVDSTNNEAKRMLASGFSGNALIAAETQTMGRGRKGKTFYSPAGSGLYLSLILQGEELTDRVSLLTIVTACAVLRALQKKTEAPVQLKWVNDLFVGERKVGGILSEAITDLESGRTEAVVIGIGINLTDSGFPEELKEVAGSLSARIPRNLLIAEIVKELLAADWAKPEKELPFYRAHSLVLGRKVWYQGETVTGEAVDEDGSLVIRFADGHTERIRGGSISLR